MSFLAGSPRSVESGLIMAVAVAAPERVSCSGATRVSAPRGTNPSAFARGSPFPEERTMPFDGGEFSQASGPWPLTPPPAVGRKPLAAWLRGLLPGSLGRSARSLSPERPGVATEVAAVHLLQAARALIEAEEAWGQGAYQTSGGRRCAVGALRAAAARAGWRDSYANREAHALLLGVARERGFDSVEAMNDRSSHAQVLAAFDAAGWRAVQH